MSGDPLIPPLSLLLKIQQETRFGEMSKLDIEFKKAPVINNVMSNANIEISTLEK